MKKSIADSYDKIAEEYTQKHGYGEQLSLPALKKFLTFLPQSANILDIGCGGGQDAHFLAKNGCEVLGIDISPKMIELSRKNFPGIDFQIADLFDLKSKNQYDGIWCCRVFHHISIEKQDEFLAKIHSLLKIKAILYLTSVVSDKKENYEAFDSGSDNLLKKRLTESYFKKLTEKHGFELLAFNLWTRGKGMEVFLKKSLKET